MSRRRQAFCALALSTAVIATIGIGVPSARAQQTLNGNAFALRSSGAAGGTDWTLSTNGYVGTYVTLAAPGSVSFAVQAQGVGSGGIDPNMNLVVADTKVPFSVTSGGFNTYNANISLPAGTYFVRTELANNTPTAPRTLTVRDMQISGATVANSSTDSLALNAANSYINNFRKGNASVALTGPGNIPLLAGTQVSVDMKRNAFNFGGTVSGSSLGDSKDMLVPNPSPTSEARQFQDFINQYFNTIVPSNAGKWSNNEATRNVPTMALVDRQLNYAQAHNMRARMHTLIWGSGATSGSQQPGWVNTLISSAAAGNAASKADLRNAINSRINYYVGTNGNRSLKYIEIDGLNEALHNPSYWNIYNPATNSGSLSLADVYNQVANAAAAAGNPNLRTYLNEYNVLQFSPNSISSTGAESGSDQYANWYRNEVEAVENGGGAVSGVGIQEYTSLTATGSNAHSPATFQKAMQNLSIAGLPLSMTEWGMASGTTTADRNALGPAALDSAARMFFGNPQASTFMVWGWWDVSGATPPCQMIITTPGQTSYTLTPVGQKWVDLMNEFSTDLNATVNPDGSIAFNGFFGDYNIGQQSGFSNLALSKGTNGYSLQLAAPPQWSMWNPSNSGSWDDAGNWTNGGVANSAGQTAYFGNAASSRSVTLNGNRTIGMLAFDSAAAYTIGGAGSITMDGPANLVAMYVVNGSHNVNVPVALAASDDLNVTITQPSSTLTLANLQQSSAVITKNGAGRLAVNNVRAAGLSINAGTVEVMPGGGVSRVDTLAIAGGPSAPTASLDLQDNDLIVTNSSYADISSAIAYARHGGAWDRNGITSSAAANATNQDRTLGAMTGDEFLSTGSSIFDGFNVAASDVLVKYTYYGDSDFNGKVDGADYARTDTSFNNESATQTDIAGWINGDFDYNGKVDGADYALMDAAFNSQSGTIAGAAVPEPATAATILLSMMSLRRRRRAPAGA